jgi:hypothetical protein
MRLPEISDRTERLFGGVLIGVFLFFLSYLLDYLLGRSNIRPADTISNNLLIGLLGAAGAYLWARFEAERNARSREKLILAIELNHHIRNALTMIRQSASLEDEQTKLRLIDEAVDRIDRVLTELVPTAGEASRPRFFLDYPDEMGRPLTKRDDPHSH